MTLYWPGGPLIWLLTSFVVTVVLSRFITSRIRAGHGRFSDVAVGALHIHHMVWGVGLVLLCGTVAFAFRPQFPYDIAPAIGFGAGAALMLDEFALILYVRDVYWAEEGRLSLAAMVVMAVGVGMIALPLSHLPQRSLPIVAPIVAVYVAFTAVCLAKGKVLTSLAGLFVAPVVLYGGLRLARPDSPWARRRYATEKRQRARERYANRVVRERRRERLLELISGTDVPGGADMEDRQWSMSTPPDVSALGSSAPGVADMEDGQSSMSTPPGVSALGSSASSAPGPRAS